MAGRRSRTIGKIMSAAGDIASDGVEIYNFFSVLHQDHHLVCVCVYMIYMWKCMLCHVYRDQRTTLWGQFSPSTFV